MGNAPRIFGGKFYLDFWVEILSLISGGKCFLEFSVGNATSNLGWKMLSRIWGGKYGGKCNLEFPVGNDISNLGWEMLPRIFGGKCHLEFGV